MANSDEFKPFTYQASQTLRIPTRRIGAVIGSKGSNREKIEQQTQTIIVIDSDTGEVEIKPNKELKDPVQLIKAANIVKAIGRGFSYATASKLHDDDYFLEIIRLKSLVSDKPNHLKRIKARIIGTNGRTKKAIEELTSINLVISGNTVALIGKYEDIEVARDAVIKIIKGMKIDNALAILEDYQRTKKQENKTIWKTEEEQEQDAVMDNPLDELVDEE